MKYLMSVLCSVLLVGCVSSTHTVPPSNNVSLLTTGDLSFLSHQSQRFAIHPSISQAYITDKLDSAQLTTQIESAIVTQMVKKGYIQVSYTQSPDLLVGFGLATETQLSDQEILSKIGLSAGLVTADVDSEKFEKGSVVVALFSPNQPLPKWKVLAQGMTEIERSDDSRQQRIDKLMQSMLRSIPAN